MPRHHPEIWSQILQQVRVMALNPKPLSLQTPTPDTPKPRTPLTLKVRVMALNP